MRLAFLELPAGERRLYLEQAAVRRNLSPVILEKDFWVCWLLGMLFESEFAGSLVFKGGTTLSKVFGVPCPNCPPFLSPVPRVVGLVGMYGRLRCRVSSAWSALTGQVRL